MRAGSLALAAGLGLLLGGAPVLAAADQAVVPANGKLKVFILAGQSNMEGFGQVAGDSPGTMETLVRENPEAYAHLVDDEGRPLVRDDVWLVNISNPEAPPTKGWLTTGFGAGGGHIGPEYGFGWVMGELFEDPVLLIKCAWGGRSLAHNFLSPSAGDYPPPQEDGDMGFQYAEVLRMVAEVTGDLERYFPDYAGGGFELAGFGWHQGWNDRINADAVDAYEENLVHFIKDIRNDLGVENLPFVVANTGISGWDPSPRYKARVEKHMEAQLAVADGDKYPEFAGNVAGVETRDFWRTQEQSPSGQGFHWHRNWETLYLIGTGMGEAMAGLLQGGG